MKMTEGRTNEMAESGEQRRQIGVLKYVKTKKKKHKRENVPSHM